MNKIKTIRNEGFTLIELLIVIAILGTLAVVVLLALNPLQQLARTRDAGRSSTVAQLGHAVEAYATTHNGAYPTTATCAGSTWITNCLVTTGEIQAAPSRTSNSTCTGGSDQNGFCYAGGATGAFIWTNAEATANTSKCGAAGAPAGCGAGTATFLYATNQGRGGLYCGSVPPSGSVTFCD